MYKQIWERICSARYIVIVSHMFPDGDTLGSSIALYESLKNIGKRVVLFNATMEHLPHEFSFLNAFNKISDKLPKEFDTVISCDCPNIKKLGLQTQQEYTLINLDHHESNTRFGDFNLIEGSFSSAGLVIYKLLRQNEVVITKECAKALYTSIADDTGFFRYGNLDKECFEAAAYLTQCGIKPEEISSKVNSSVSLAKIRLRAYMLNNFVLHENATIASIIFTKDIIKQCGTQRSETKNIVSELRDLATVQLAIMILEQEGYLKVSLRSNGSINVSQIAQYFGGGGHKSAAGFDVKEGCVQEILEKIIRESKGK